MTDTRHALAALTEIEEWFEKREAVAGDLGALDEQLEMAGLAGRVAGIRAALSAQPVAGAVAEPDCWAILTPNGSKLVSPDEAKGRKDAYPLAASPHAEQSAQGEPVACVTEEMVTAYLTANDAYWKRIDSEPTKLGKWRNGTPSEATRVSLMAALASAPPTPPPGVVEAVPLTAREIELIDGMIDVQLYHAKQCDGIANRTMADKQKGWDMERVELLRKLRGIPPKAAQPVEGER